MGAASGSLTSVWWDSRADSDLVESVGAQIQLLNHIRMRHASYGITSPVQMG